MFLYFVSRLGLLITETGHGSIITNKQNQMIKDLDIVQRTKEEMDYCIVDIRNVIRNCNRNIEFRANEIELLENMIIFNNVNDSIDDSKRFHIYNVTIKMAIKKSLLYYKDIIKSAYETQNIIDPLVRLE